MKNVSHSRPAGNLIGNISWNGALVIYELEGTTLFHYVPGRN